MIDNPVRGCFSQTDVVVATIRIATSPAIKHKTCSVLATSQMHALHFHCASAADTLISSCLGTTVDWPLTQPLREAVSWLPSGCFGCWFGFPCCHSAIAKDQDLCNYDAVQNKTCMYVEQTHMVTYIRGITYRHWHGLCVAAEARAQTPVA